MCKYVEWCTNKSVCHCPAVKHLLYKYCNKNAQMCLRRTHSVILTL